MNDKYSALPARLNLIGLVVLVVGIASAGLILLTCHGQSDAALGFQVVDGVAYPVAPQDDRRYQFEIEKISGKSGVFVDQFTTWFSGLWHGRSLAYMVAGLSIVTAAVLFFVAKEVAEDRAYRAATDARSGVTSHDP